jgi:hypothetical protein
MEMTEAVLGDAIKYQSFAGMFPYSSNAPMKTFAGNEPSVPVSVMVNALDAMQRGAASRGALAEAKSHLNHQPNDCVAQCTTQHTSCLNLVRGSTSNAAASNVSSNSNNAAKGSTLNAAASNVPAKLEKEGALTAVSNIPPEEWKKCYESSFTCLAHCCNNAQQ